MQNTTLSLQPGVRVDAAAFEFLCTPIPKPPQRLRCQGSLVTIVMKCNRFFCAVCWPLPDKGAGAVPWSSRLKRDKGTKSERRSAGCQPKKTERATRRPRCERNKPSRMGHRTQAAGRRDGRAASLCCKATRPPVRTTYNRARTTGLREIPPTFCHARQPVALHSLHPPIPPPPVGGDAVPPPVGTRAAPAA